MTALTAVKKILSFFGITSLICLTVITCCSDDCPEEDYCHFVEIIKKRNMLDDKQIDRAEYDYLVSSILPTTQRPSALKLLPNANEYIEEAVEVLVSPDSMHRYNIDFPKPVQLSAVKLYLETSESMKGYAKGYTSSDYEDFGSFISALNTRSATAFEVYTIGDEVEPVPASIAWDATYKDTEKYGGSSPLNTILIGLSEQLDEQTVVLFITDALLSYSTAEIETYKEMNDGKHKNWWEYSALKDSLQRVLNSRLFDSNFGVNIYKLSVPFKWYYWNYANAKSEGTFNDPDRPLYVFAFGKEDNVKEIDSIWKEKLQPGTYEILEFTGSIEKNSFPRILKRFGKKGEWQVEGDHFNVLSVSKDNLAEELEFAMLTYMPSLPRDLQDLDRIKANLIDPSGKVFVTDVIEANLTATHPEYKNLFPDEQAINMLYHCIVKCSVATDKLHPGDNTIRIELKRDEQDSWVDKISIDKDLDITDVPGRTWKFKEFITAFKEASRYEAAVYVSEITIKVE